jgi:hypothetical protein
MMSARLRLLCWVAVIAACAGAIWSGQRRAQRQSANVAPLMNALNQSAEKALPAPKLSTVQIEIRSADPTRAADELVGLATKFDGSAYAIEEGDDLRITANIPRAKARQFADATGGEYRLDGPAEDWITFDVVVRRGP